MNTDTFGDEQQTLAAKAKTLSSALARGRDGDNDALEAIRRLAHQLADSSRNDDPLSATAQEVERASNEEILSKSDDLLREIIRRTQHIQLDTETVLVIEDDQELTEQLVEQLAVPGREILTASSASQAVQVIGERRISLIVLDLFLPDMDGRNLLLQLREDQKTATTPIIVLGTSGTALETECFALGADGHFEKPIDLSSLAASVSTTLQHARETKQDARRDRLTGLLNRSAFTESYTQNASLAFRNGEPLSIAILDLDHFKDVNDKYGRRIGDEVLKVLAKILEETLRKSDILTRWGGEEFVVLMPDSEADGGRRAMEKALNEFSTRRFGTNGEEMGMTFSAGVAQIQMNDSLEEAVERADRLLYLAKSAGRNRIIARHEEVSSQRPHVLLAEDDEMISAVIQHRLAREGWKVDSFADGAQANEAAQKKDYSLYLLDIQLPGANGFDILRTVRSGQKSRRTPVVIITSMGREKDIARGFELGATDYIVKPLSPIELVSRLRRLLIRK